MKVNRHARPCKRWEHNCATRDGARLIRWSSPCECGLRAPHLRPIQQRTTDEAEAKGGNT